MHSHRFNKLIAISSLILTTSVSQADHIVWENPHIAEPLPVGTKSFDAVFKFTVEGENPVLIEDLKVDCGCTTAALASNRFKPGESGEIALNLDARGLAGSVERELIVYWRNDQEEADLFSSRLVLSVEVTPLIRTSPRVLFWRKGEPPTEKKMKISIHPEAKEVELRLGKSPDNLISHLNATGSPHEFEVVAKPLDANQPNDWHVPLELWEGNVLRETRELYVLVR
ncbi:MAG: hypothetical protein SynsKO_04210 [Synoicihabitans sp.]